MVSEIGPAKRPPAPKPIKNRPVARDSVTSETPKSTAACTNAAESIEEANPTTAPMDAMLNLAYC